MNLPHTVTIERASEGTANDRGVPAQTWATLETARAFVQPRDVRELGQLSQGGPVVSTHVIYLDPSAALAESDRISFGGSTYQVDGVRDAAGLGHHLEVDAHLVEVP